MNPTKSETKEDSSLKANRFENLVRSLAANRMGFVKPGDQVHFHHVEKIEEGVYGGNEVYLRSFGITEATNQIVSGVNFSLPEINLVCDQGTCKFFVVVEGVTFDPKEAKSCRRAANAQCHIYSNGCDITHFKQIKAALESLVREIFEQVHQFLHREHVRAFSRSQLSMA